MYIVEFQRRRGNCCSPYSGCEAVAICDSAERRESPPWDIEDNESAPSAIDPSRARLPFDDAEGGPPPLSQLTAPTLVSGGPSEYGLGIPFTGGPGGKSTPSTLSDDVGEGDDGNVGVAKGRGQGTSTAKKRTSSKGGESEEHDTPDEGLDTKRKPRKSARLA